MAHNVRNWAELPEPLMAKVLKALSFSSILALRRVCRDWHAAVAHHAGVCRPNPVLRHVLLVADGKEYVCYSPQKDQWFRGALFSPSAGALSDRGAPPRLRGSAGGLLLFAAGDALLVCNPLTKRRKELPRIVGRGAEIGAAAMGMAYHAPSRSYLVVVAESDHKRDGSAITAVYNSLAGAWTVTPGMKGKTFAREFMELVYSNGSFFGTVAASPHAKERSGQLPYLLVRYRVQQQRWSAGEAAPLPCASFAYLGEMDGQILLAARNNEITEVSVWELSRAEGKWNLVNAKGMSLVEYFSLVKTIFVGDFLFWKTQDRPSLLVHNLKRHSWNSARELPEDFGPDQAYCAFEPSLFASP